MARQLHRYSSTTSFPASFVSATFILIVAPYPLTFHYWNFFVCVDVEDEQERRADCKLVDGGGGLVHDECVSC